ncbi:forespore capture DNA-binding protein RefZ [Bacillus salitolerans]|uniref:Forespore capture DNA-binding protein RefZ n=1 Tax=Bacillus salitolerans TaxID=1437434 RepID=A0ABW4LVZ5_9BACI
MSSSISSKEKVIHAAISLFNTKGFSGTSVRDISDKANVNVAVISYYFKNKKGLLEYLIATFLDQYIIEMESVISNEHLTTSKEVLRQMIHRIFCFQSENRHLARFVYREMTLDNVLIREVMTTYLAKEKYYFKQIFEKGIRNGEFRRVSVPTVIAQLKGMITMPFLQPQYLTEVLHVVPYDDFFYKQFEKEMERWMEFAICLPPHSQKLALHL